MKGIAPDQAAALNQLGLEINAQLQRTAFELVSLGRMLREAKEMVGHGHFGSWVQDVCGLSPRTASQFMLVESRFGDRVEVMRGLPSGVVLELASPRVPDEIVEKVVSRQIPARVSEIREALKGESEERRFSRVSQSFVDLIFALPDSQERAAKRVAKQLLREEEQFITWTRNLLVRIVNLLDER